MTPLFNFERKNNQEHLCIPMHVRFKLDCCGLKVTTQQWQNLIPEEKEIANSTPCQTVDERTNYKEVVGTIILARTGQRAGEMAPEPMPAWLNERIIPSRVENAFASNGCGLTVEQWSDLAPIQRFALIKLTRPGHEMTSSFVEALKEFGLLK